MRRMAKCIAIAILFLTSSCQMLMNGRPSHEDLKWTPIKNANKLVKTGPYNKVGGFLKFFCGMSVSNLGLEIVR